MNTNNTRRQFMKKALTASAGVAALSTMELGLMKSAFAQNSCANGEYKALVCVFLYGGNDSYNMLVPMRGDALADYQGMRGKLARNDALEIYPTGHNISGGIGFVPEMQSLKNLFDSGKLAIQGNVGTLVKPLVGSNGKLLEGIIPKPLTLASHSAQASTWQRGAESNQAGIGGTGWSGRMMDSLICQQTDDHFLQSISFGGQNLWQVGANNRPYSLDTDSIKKISMFHKDNELGKRLPIIENLLQNQKYENILQQAYAETLKRAENNARNIETDIDDITDLTTEFPEGGLSEQFKVVTKLMRLGKSRGLKRQVFLVGIGGFDTHEEQDKRHSGLLENVSNSLASFYQSTIEMGMEENVTSFTMSEFGRNLVPNESLGTDHGWAGHQLILGGAVKGGLYGDILTQSQETLDNLGGGLVPTTATEEMYASLAQWFGLNRANCDDVFPNLKNFVDEGKALNIDYFT